MALYELAVLGSPSADQLASIAVAFEQAASQFKLRVGDEIKLLAKPETFHPDQRTCAAAVFFGGPGGADIDISKVINVKSIPILPVVSTSSAVSSEIPESLR